MKLNLSIVVKRELKKKKEYSIIDKFLRKQIFQLKSKDNKE